MTYIWILLVVIILLLGFLIYLNIKDGSQSIDSKESLRDLDKAVERQEATLFDLTKDIQSFQDPLNKLCLLYTSPSPRDRSLSRMPSSA